MSELINNSEKRKELLKHMILQLHSGEAPALVRNRLAELLQSIPYDEVVDVEQELIAEGLPVEEVLRLCDIHSMVLEGHIDQSGAKPIPPGHPVDTFMKENRELEKVVDAIEQLLARIPGLKKEEIKDVFLKLHARFNELMDVDKHYKRKEYLLFPFLEKYEITGPPKVMWGKHDEIREQLKAAIEVVSAPGEISPEEAGTVAEMIIAPAARAIPDMILKEEEILFPMSMDELTDDDWYAVYQQTLEFGYCLYDPQDEWTPEGVTVSEAVYNTKNLIQLTTGSFSMDEMEALFKTLPIDITFVDKDDKVKFFSLGPDRIFSRNRAILGRDVRMCHPPSSVHIVDQILDDFRSGKENSAAFWINMQGRFIHIEYFAMRDKQGAYLGTVEFTQDLTHVRSLEGEQRLLSYGKK
ncbi:DUF438 domain-containing protein [Gaoshiqia sp. Z1-71]|uniref:DUF438 domain-containing protein n=1 Tax=Gaoshiqia hydrogeniformans TaxID=3290090 RepID=UPI003BF78151